MDEHACVCAEESIVEPHEVPDNRAESPAARNGHVKSASRALDIIEGLAATPEGLGFTDVSDSKDRKYFHSVYFRTPGGALFEAAYSIPESFEIDETMENLGKDFQLPPWLEDRKQELLSKLEKIDF